MIRAAFLCFAIAWFTDRVIAGVVASSYGLVTP